ncbi:hypothetical protein D3C71_1964270 [compost metagenome]
MLGLPVVAYGVPPGSYLNRVRGMLAAKPDPVGVLRDPDGLAVEDFGLAMNLMLACSVELAVSAEEAVQRVARLIAQGR